MLKQCLEQVIEHKWPRERVTRAVAFWLGHGRPWLAERKFLDSRAKWRWRDERYIEWSESSVLLMLPILYTASCCSTTSKYQSLWRLRTISVIDNHVNEFGEDWLISDNSRQLEATVLMTHCKTYLCQSVRVKRECRRRKVCDPIARSYLLYLTISPCTATHSGPFSARSWGHTSLLYYSCCFTAIACEYQEPALSIIISIVLTI